MTSSIVSYQASGDGAVARPLAEKLEDLLSIRDFGAVIDGETDDFDAWKAAFDHIESVGGGRLHFPAGTSIVGHYLIAPDGLHLVGDGPNNSVIKCIAEADPPQLAAAIWLGNFHLWAQGNRLTGSGGPWVRSLEVDEGDLLYPCSGPVSETAVSVTLATPGHAGSFVVGEIAYLRSAETVIEIAGSYDLELPIQNSLVKIVSANATTGLIEFERAAGFTSATAPYLCRIVADAEDGYGPVHFAQDVTIENVGFEGACAVGSNSAAAYDCHYSNIGGDVADVIRANNLAYCSIDGFFGIWREVLAEIKFGAHDTLISRLGGCCPNAVTTSTPYTVPPISIGEYARNIRILDFSIDAPLHNGYAAIGLQPGTGCHLRGRINLPSATAAPILLFADPGISPADSIIELAGIHKSAIHVLSQATVGAANQLPRDIRIVATLHTLSEAATQWAAYVDGGTNIDITGSQFTSAANKGGLHFGAEAVGCRVVGCVMPESAVGGAGASANVVGPNFKREASGALIPFGEIGGSALTIDYNGSTVNFTAYDHELAAAKSHYFSGLSWAYADPSAGIQVTMQNNLVYATGTVDIGYSGGRFRNLELSGSVKIGGNQVVGAQGAVIADATDATSAITQLNLLLARCRAHGLIAT